MHELMITRFGSNTISLNNFRISLGAQNRRVILRSDVRRANNMRFDGTEYVP